MAEERRTRSGPTLADRYPCLTPEEIRSGFRLTTSSNPQAIGGMAWTDYAHLDALAAAKGCAPVPDPSDALPASSSSSSSSSSSVRPLSTPAVVALAALAALLFALRRT